METDAHESLTHSGRFSLQSFCPRGRSEQVSTFAIGV